MRKFTAIIAALAVAAGVTAPLPVMAQQNSNNLTVQQCVALVQFQLFSTQGECMSQLRTGAPNVCKLMKEYGLLDAFGFRNIGDCVSTYRGN